MFSTEEGNPCKSTQHTTGLMALGNKAKTAGMKPQLNSEHPGDPQHHIGWFLNFPSTFVAGTSKEAGCDEHALHSAACIAAEQLSCVISPAQFQSGSQILSIAGCHIRVLDSQDPQPETIQKNRIAAATHSDK